MSRNPGTTHTNVGIPNGTPCQGGFAIFKIPSPIKPLTPSARGMPPEPVSIWPAKARYSSRFQQSICRNIAGIARLSIPTHPFTYAATMTEPAAPKGRRRTKGPGASCPSCLYHRTGNGLQRPSPEQGRTGSPPPVGSVWKSSRRCGQRPCTGVSGHGRIFFHVYS